MLILLVSLAFILLLILNIFIVLIVNSKNEEEAYRPFFDKWDCFLKMSKSKAEYIFLEVFYFLPTIVAYFSRRKHSKK